MAKKGRKTDDEPVVDAPLPETEELPHDRFPPVWRNVYWGQVLFGAVATWLALEIAARWGPGFFASPKGFLLVLGAIATVLAFVVYLHNLYKHGLVPDYSLKCRFCNGPVNRYSEFCEHCGADLIAEEKLVPCPRCGAEVYEGTKHCPECGANVVGGKHGKAGKKKGKGARLPDEDGGWDAPLGVDNPNPWEKR